MAIHVPGHRAREAFRSILAGQPVRSTIAATARSYGESLHLRRAPRPDATPDTGGPSEGAPSPAPSSGSRARGKVPVRPSAEIRSEPTASGPSGQQGESLLQKPTELQELMLQTLDGATLARMREVCRDLRRLVDESAPLQRGVLAGFVDSVFVNRRGGSEGVLHAFELGDIANSLSETPAKAFVGHVARRLESLPTWFSEGGRGTLDREVGRDPWIDDDPYLSAPFADAWAERTAQDRMYQGRTRAIMAGGFLARCTAISPATTLQPLMKLLSNPDRVDIAMLVKSSGKRSVLLKLQDRALQGGTGGPLMARCREVMESRPFTPTVTGMRLACEAGLGQLDHVEDDPQRMAGIVEAVSDGLGELTTLEQQGEGTSEPASGDILQRLHARLAALEPQHLTELKQQLAESGNALARLQRQFEPLGLTL